MQGRILWGPSFFSALRLDFRQVFGYHKRNVGNVLRNTNFLIAGLLILVLTHESPGQESVSQNPYTSVADLYNGARNFRNHCAICHALDATGESGPDLTRSEYRHGNSNSALFRIVSQGITGTSMAAHRFTDREVWQLVAYLRSLDRRSAPERLPGDPAEGKVVFEEQGDCSRCHMVDGRGGRLGPDLSDVGWKRSASFLKESILEPTAEIGNSSETFVDGTRRYWPVTLTLADGNSVQGVVLNEDSYSIQVMDEEERLLAYSKKLLKEIRRGQVSAMPTFQDDLSEAEVDDLVAYLASLKRK